MKVLFVTDETYEQRGYGGAEITIKEMGDRAPEGIEVEYLSLTTYKKANTHGDWTPRDLTVFSNIALWDRADVDALARETPHVKMEFDWGFCKTHLKKCEDGCKSCVDDGWYRTFLQGAERIFFTCPMQKDWYRQILGTVADNSILNPSWIDPDRFPHLEWNRIPNSVMYHGRLFPHKGVLTMLTQAVMNPDIQFTFVGDGPPEIERAIESVHNCRVIRSVPYQLIPYLLNATENWMMLSEWDDTGPMSAIEAYLCGAKVIHNNRLGYFSYPWNWDKQDTVREELKKIPTRFWDTITNILNEVTP